LQTQYESKGLQIVGFPCAQFGLQEIGSEAEILNCLKHVRPGNGYPGPNFPLTKKVLINGPDADPIYKWLKRRAPTASEPSDNYRWLEDTKAFRATVCESPDVPWNFHKFLVARDGKTVKRFHQKRLPFDPDLIKAIDEFINEK